VNIYKTDKIPQVMWYALTSVRASWQIRRHYASSPLRQAPQVAEPRLWNAGADLGRLGSHLVPDRLRHEPQRPATSYATRLHVLQLGLPDFLVDGLVLHTLCGHVNALLAHVSNDSPEGARGGIAQTFAGYDQRWTRGVIGGVGDGIRWTQRQETGLQQYGVTRESSDF